MLYSKLKEVLQSVYRDTDVVFDVSCDYNNDKMFTVVILYPELHITNTEEHEITVNNFLVKVKGFVKQNDNNELIIREFHTLQAYNLCPTEQMLFGNYAHSHVSGLSLPTVCLGDTILNSTYTKLRTNHSNGVNEDDVYDFFSLLDTMLHWESLEGGPYKYISDIHDIDIDDLPYDDPILTHYEIENFKQDYEIKDLRANSLEMAPDYIRESELIEGLKNLKDLYNKKEKIEDLTPTIIHGLKQFSNDLKKHIEDLGLLAFNNQYQTNYDWIDSYDYYDIEQSYIKVFQVVNYFNLTEITVTKLFEHYGEYLLEETGPFTKWLVEPDTEEYLQLYDSNEDDYFDALFSINDVHNYINEYVIHGDDYVNYDDLSDYVNSLSFLVNNKFYKGNAPRLQNNNNKNFDIDENTKELKAIQCRKQINGIIQICSKSSKRNEAAARDTVDFLKSASASFGQVSL